MTGSEEDVTAGGGPERPDGADSASGGRQPPDSLAHQGADAPRSPGQATGLRRWLYLGAGFACVGLAYLGAILPGLPTTPWVLLASYCFGRSSPRLQRWVRRSPVFGRLVRDWEDHRGIRRPVKVFAVCLIVAVVTASILSGRLPVWLRWVVGGAAACGVCVILFVVPTVRPGGRDGPTSA